MTDLTEQFNHGLLPDGWYYYKASDGRSNIATEYGLFCIEADNKVKIEVLAKVPSYEEYQALLSDQLAKKEGEEINAELVQKIHILNEANMKLENEVGKFGEENTKLKSEYEKECKRADELEDSYWKEVEKNKKLKKYEQIVTSYNMKPIDYEIACETVNKLLDEKKALKEENAKLKELLKECKDTMNKAGYLFAKIDDVKKTKRLLKQIEEVLK